MIIQSLILADTLGAYNIYKYVFCSRQTTFFVTQVTSCLINYPVHSFVTNFKICIVLSALIQQVDLHKHQSHVFRVPTYLLRSILCNQGQFRESR